MRPRRLTRSASLRASLRLPKIPTKATIFPGSSERVVARVEDARVQAEPARPAGAGESCPAVAFRDGHHDGVCVARRPLERLAADAPARRTAGDRSDSSSSSPAVPTSTTASTAAAMASVAARMRTGGRRRARRGAGEATVALRLWAPDAREAPSRWPPERLRPLPGLRARGCSSGLSDRTARGGRRRPGARARGEAALPCVDDPRPAHRRGPSRAGARRLQPRALPGTARPPTRSARRAPSQALASRRRRRRRGARAPAR